MPAYNRQLKDQDDNIIYPIINGDSLPDDSITTNKIADGAVTESKIDWTESPCVSTFVFSGTAMPATDQHITKTTKRGTQLSFYMSGNSLYIESGADNILKARYSISYQHANTTDTYGCTGLATNTDIWSYLTGLGDGSAANTRNQHSTGSSTYGSIADTYGIKTTFAAVFDVIRSSTDPDNTKSKMWFMMGNIISSGSATALITRCQVISTTVGTIPSLYQRGVAGTSYYIVVEVWEN